MRYLKLIALPFLILLFLLFPAVISGQEQTPPPDFAQIVIELTNEARASVDLPPLKRNDLLMAAAQGHTDDMARDDFYGHENPFTGTAVGDRVSATGYQWTAVAENIAAVSASPREVVAGWLNSPGHLENILNTNFSEIGVGYTFDEDDTLLLENNTLPTVHYWAQNFGQQRSVFPLIINDEAWATNGDLLDLYIYGKEWAQEMRLRDDGSEFGEWQPFQERITWTLSPGLGEREVTVELRNGNNELISSDRIWRTDEGLPELSELEVPPPAQLPDSLPRHVPESLTLSKDPESLFLRAGDNATINIILSGASPEVCQGIPGRPLDIMVVFDRSTSAGVGSDSNLEYSKQTLINLLDNLEQPVYTNLDDQPGRSRMGLITSSVDPTGAIPLLEQELTDEYALLREKIEIIEPAGDTELEESIDLAVEAIANTTNKHAKAILLMLHDDVQLDEETVTSIALARQAGIEVFMLVNPLNIESDQIGAEEAAGMVGERNSFFLQPGAGPSETRLLRDLFIRASEGLEGTSARVLRLTDSIEPSGILEITNSGSGTLVNGNHIVWEIIEIPVGEEVRLAYEVQLPANAGPAGAEIDSDLIFIDCNGYLQESVTTQQPVDVGPTPTPTATLTPTPIPTPVGIFVEPTLGPTPTHEGPGLIERVVPTSPGRAFCSSSIWWLPALLLPLLVLLLWYLYLRSIGSDLGTEARLLSTLRCIPCLLFWLYLLFFAFLVGLELFTGLCQGDESVYFWRLDSGVFSRSGVYLSVPESPDEPPVAFEAVNDQAGCVGCHAVSSSANLIAAVEGPPPNRVIVRRLDGTAVEIPEITASFVAWSPDGSQLAYDGQEGDIHVLDLESGATTAIEGASESGITEVMPAWSADGQQIAFVRYEGTVDYPFVLPGPTDIMIVPASGGEARTVPGASLNGLNYYPAFSPDGRWLAFTHHTNEITYADPEAEIFLVPTEGGEPIRLQANDGPSNEVIPEASNSWATWSQDGSLLAFNSKRDDPNFDIFITDIDANGNSSPARTLPAAAQTGVFEHTPFWGEPIQPEPLLDRLLGLWPWLIPLIILLILCLIFCRRPKPIQVLPAQPGSPAPMVPPGEITPWRPTPFWDPGAALIIGIGGSGRHVLTHLKKNLLDAGAGDWPEQIRIALIDTAEAESAGERQGHVSFAGISLDEKEKLPLDEHLYELIQNMVKDETAEPEMRDWLPARYYNDNLYRADFDLRQGTGRRRALARAGLVRQLQDGGRDSHFWQWLSTSMDESKRRGDRVTRVFVVGSLAGGMGGGLAADIPYLARLAAGELGLDATIEGFFIGSGALSEYATNEQERNHMQGNTFATLRELSRFQLSAGRPFPMIYKKDAVDKLLNGYCQASTYDGLHIADKNALWSGRRPDEAIYPAVADTLLSLLDRASESPDQNVQPYRAGARNATVALQGQLGEAAVGTFGSYTYRLPFLDIMAALRNRFALDLLYHFLTGSESRDIDLNEPLPPELNRELIQGQKASVEIHARDILRGYQELSPPHEIRLIDYVTDDGVSLSADNRRLLQNHLSLMNNSGDHEYINQRKNAFQMYLVQALLPVINGRQDSTLEIGRSGKLGYVIVLLKTVKSRLERNRSTLQDARGTVATDHANKIDHLAALLRACGEVCDIVRTDLEKQADLLVKRVFPRLQDESAQLAGYREEMRAVAVRHYFLEDNFLDEIYEKHLHPRILGAPNNPGLLAQLYWEPVEDLETRRQLRLRIGMVDEREIPPSADPAQETISRLYALASLGLEDLANRQNLLLAERLSQTVLSRDEINHTAQTFVRESTPLVDVLSEKSDITHLQVNHFLYANNRIDQRGELLKRLQPLLDGMNLNGVQATDPFSMQFLAYRDVIPLSALRLWQQTAETYRSLQIDRRWREPLHVFAAERNSSAYEGRLPEVNENRRLFVPLLVAGLENVSRARNFAWALAAGLVQIDFTQGDNNYTYRLVLPQAGVNVALTRSEDAVANLAPIVAALHTCVLGHPDLNDAHKKYSVEQLSDLVGQELLHMTGVDQRIAKFDPQLLPNYHREENRIGARDMLSFLRIAIYDWGRGRRPDNPNSKE